MESNDDSEEETKSRNVKIMSVLGIMFSMGTLFILIAMFVTYEMFFVNSLYPRYLESTTYDSDTGDCEEKYVPAYPLMRFNLTSKKDLYGVFEKIGDYGTVFDDILGCECSTNNAEIYKALSSGMDANETYRKERACNYLCNYKNSKHEDLNGMSVEAFTPTNIRNKFVGLREEDNNNAFEDYFFDEVCMERFEEWSDYIGRRCDKCAKEFFRYKDGLETVKSRDDDKECIKKNRTLVSSERLRPRQYRRCNTCSRDVKSNKDPCYAHALCNYVTNGTASIAITRGNNVYCVKAGCTKENDEGISNLLGGGREYEFSRYNYAIYFVTFCFGLLYSILTSVFFIVRIVNGPKLCGHDEFDKMKIAADMKDKSYRDIDDDALQAYRKEKQDRYKESRRRKRQRNDDDKNDKDDVGYSSFVSCCAAFFIYGHLLQGIVYVVLVSVCTLGVIAPLTKPMQRVVNNVVNETYYGDLNPLFTSEVGFWYDLNGWTITLMVFSYATFIIDMSSGIYLFFCFKDNKVNITQALFKRFMNGRSKSWYRKVISRKVKNLDKVDTIMTYLYDPDSIPDVEEASPQARQAKLSMSNIVEKVIDNTKEAQKAQQEAQKTQQEAQKVQQEEEENEDEEGKKDDGPTLRSRSTLRF